MVYYSDGMRHMLRRVGTITISALTPMLPHRTELPCLLRHPMRFARRYRMALMVLVPGAAADLLTTWHNLRLYSAQVEAHPVQRWISQLIGVNAGVPLAKACQLACVLLVAAWWKPWTAWLMLVCGLLYLAAAVSNHYLLL